MTLHIISTKALLRALPRVRQRDGRYCRRCKRAVILDLLRNGPIRTGEIVEYLYGDAEDGGPLTASDGVRVAIWHLRQRGFEIRHDFRLGYSIENYDRAAAS